MADESATALAGFQLPSSARSPTTKTFWPQVVVALTPNETCAAAVGLGVGVGVAVPSAGCADVQGDRRRWPGTVNVAEPPDATVTVVPEQPPLVVAPLITSQ